MADPTEKVDGEAGIEFATLDSILPEVWPDEFAKSLEAWQQGHMLPGSTLSWAAPSGLDVVTGIDSGAEEGQEASRGWCHVSVSDLQCHWAIVTSQTCDIVAYGPGARHPFVQVSPVYLLSEVSSNRRNAIEGHEVSHLVALSIPPSPGFWVADLRVSLPVSKHLLANSSPVLAFSSDQDSLDFSEHVAARIRRPSLHDAVSDVMVKSIGQYVKSTNKGNPEWWENVEQLRVLITGTRLAPSSVQLVVLQQNPLDAAQKKLWRDWASSFRKILARDKIALAPVFFTSLDDMSARLYRESVPLRVVEIRRPHVW
ncbi:hypothetical protein ACH46F_36775 [Streptomyces virginiae]|uniref:hypothetical protein n=1 Tax=Streptomyces virginiae TaxID=1961 RepID=UPI0037A7927D